jgi:hypothetical protein
VQRQPKQRTGKFAAYYTGRTWRACWTLQCQPSGTWTARTGIPVTSIKVANLRLYRKAAINRWLSKLKNPYVSKYRGNAIRNAG